VEDELRCLGTNGGKVDLELTLLADQTHLAVARLAEHGTADLNRLIGPLGAGAASSGAILGAGLAPRPLGSTLRLSLRERSGLTLAATPQFLQETFQLLDLPLLLNEPPLLLGEPFLLLDKPAPKLSVFLNDFLVSRHV
jgi:hypothetical protein